MGDRVVVVTGGSRGLGAGLVRSFLDLGDAVATCSRSSTEQTRAWAADEAIAQRFLFVPGVDLADRDAAQGFVGAVIERFDRIDVLVNNAGLARDGVLGTFSDDAVDEVVDLNLKGTIHMTKLVVRRMLRQGAGRIINVSSIVGLSGYRGLSVYGATKAAIDGFTRAMARELGSRGITVNAVAPGYLRTEMTHGLDEEQMGQIARRTPAGRLGEIEDITGVVRFLASDDAAFITGHVLVVDGGLTA
ncbi:MAG: SDR family NAD(P)-dependent oxidoreductase [Actinomycetota bacterium]